MIIEYKASSDQSLSVVRIELKSFSVNMGQTNILQLFSLLSLAHDK